MGPTDDHDRTEDGTAGSDPESDADANPHPDRPADSRGSPDDPGIDLLDGATLAETYPDYRGQAVARRRLDARPAATVPPSTALSAPLADRVDTDLYTHQAEALEHLAAGRNVAVTTSTSSGKTWVYALQVARRHLSGGASTALCLYPTKALARDQEAELTARLDDWGVDAAVGVYDGDTGSERKRRLRREAAVLLTNPVGLNVYLPGHARYEGWHRFYADLDLVVVDEAHEYTGVAGTHVAWILRRLRRLLAHYGSDPQFVVTTATIGNPAAHARRLAGTEFAVVDEDGSPRGPRDVVLWDPPVEGDGQEDGSTGDPSGAPPAPDRASAGSQAARLSAHLARRGLQTLQFCSAQQGAEVAARQVSDALDDHGGPGVTKDTGRGSEDRPGDDGGGGEPNGEDPDDWDGRIDRRSGDGGDHRTDPRRSGPDGGPSVEPYHAGLGDRTRRRVEAELTAGSLDVVATTSALELGIDVGSVDATVAAGYPGTRQSFWQQVGRAGRGRSAALSVLVGGDDAMDAYVLDTPSYLFDGGVEDAVVSTDNDAIYADHLLAAAEERPLTAGDADLLGGEPRLRETVAMWQDAGVLARTGSLDGRGVRYEGDPRPQSRIDLFAGGGRQFEVVCRDGEVDHDPVARERAYRDYHEGALFLHAGRQYEVVDVTEEPTPRILVAARRTDRYTQTLSTKRIEDLRVLDSRSLAGAFDLYFGRGTVEVTYDRYTVRRVGTDEVLRGPLPTGSPPLALETELLWVSLPPDHLRRTVDRLDAGLLGPDGGRTGTAADRRVPDEPARYTYAGGIHAAEHGVIGLAPLELLIDSADVGGLSTLAHPHETVPGPVWFVHDGVDGGVGFARAIYDRFEAVAGRTRERLADCDCGRRRGCPRCVMSEDCGNGNDPLDRATARLVLEDVLAALDGGS